MTADGDLPGDGQGEPPADPGVGGLSGVWVPRLVAECREHGHSPTLEAWTSRIRQGLSPLAEDPSSPRLAGDARLVLEAWDLVVAAVGRAWERADLAATEHDTPDGGSTDGSDGADSTGIPPA